jgi:RES domain-containing protein
MGHGFEKLFPALTICSYEVDVDDIVDLTTTSGRRKAMAPLRDLKCAWLADAAAGIEPASWKIAERLRTSGAAGILVPSFAKRARPGDTNLVLWKWGDDLPYQVRVHDPDGVLPRDDASWRKSR